mmetsp:Transcript_29661/g.84848  ORF Transcript_29661/g.84848 Transcript_29661/m.84848 type:complete len:200 (-) Transcript_29661:949-1548(-)
MWPHGWVCHGAGRGTARNGRCSAHRPSPARRSSSGARLAVQAPPRALLHVLPRAGARRALREAGLVAHRRLVGRGAAVQGPARRAEPLDSLLQAARRAQAPARRPAPRAAAGPVLRDLEARRGLRRVQGRRPGLREHPAAARRARPRDVQALRRPPREVLSATASRSRDPIGRLPSVARRSHPTQRQGLRSESQLRAHR